MIDIKQNYFQLFELPVAFQLDNQLLSERYRALQKVLHPDRFAHLSERERRLSEQYTTFLNEAQSTLKSPLRRAQYLLTLQGVDTLNETSVKMEPAFLMQQMMLRETLEDAGDAADPEQALDDLRSDVEASLHEQRTQFETLFLAQSYDAAAAAVRRMQFLEKLLLEIETREDELLD